MSFSPRISISSSRGVMEIAPSKQEYRRFEPNSEWIVIVSFDTEPVLQTQGPAIFTDIRPEEVLHSVMWLRIGMPIDIKAVKGYGENESLTWTSIVALIRYALIAWRLEHGIDELPTLQNVYEAFSIAMPEDACIGYVDVYGVLRDSHQDVSNVPCQL